MESFLPLIFIFFFLAIIILQVYRPFKTLKAFRRLQQISGHFSGSHVKYSFPVPSFIGQYQGYKFVLKHDIYNKGTVFRGHYAHRISIDLYFRHSKEMEIFIYIKMPTIIFLERIKTGYQEFDNQLYIFSNLPIEARSYFHSEIRRSTIMDLVRNGWGGELGLIRIGPEKINISKDIGESTLDHTLVREILDKMLALV